jgi:hypothetical protein
MSAKARHVRGMAAISAGAGGSYPLVGLVFHDRRGPLTGAEAAQFDRDLGRRGVFPVAWAAASRSACCAMILARRSWLVSTRFLLDTVQIRRTSSMPAVVQHTTLGVMHAPTQKREPDDYHSSRLLALKVVSQFRPVRDDLSR